MTKESLSRKLTRGIFYLFSSSLAQLSLNVIMIGFIARSLGVENFGLYSAILSFVQLFEFLTDFGLNRTLIKFGSTDLTKAQVSLGNALFLKSILVIPTLALVTFLGFIAGYRNEKIIILELFTIGLILDSYGTIFSSIRRILGSFKLISFFRVLKTSVNLLIIVFALSIKNSVLSLAFANAILNLIIFIVSLVNTLLLLKPKLKLNLIKDFFKDSVIFSLSDFFLNIYSRISIVLLSFFNNLHLVGIFSAAIKFTRVANLFPTQVRFALLPTMYRIFEDREQKTEDRKQKVRRVFLIIFKYMVIFATPFVIFIYLFSGQIVHLVFGSKYDSSMPLVQLLSLFIYLRFIETPFGLFYLGMNKHKKMVYLQGFSSALNIVLNLVLIPSYSAYGACAATLISEMFFVFLVMYMGRKYLIWRLTNVVQILLKPTVAGVVSAVLTVLLLKNANIVFQILFLLICYLLFLFATKVFGKEDKELFLKIFSKNVIISE